jgi:hypothetical protein
MCVEEGTELSPDEQQVASHSETSNGTSIGNEPSGLSMEQVSADRVPQWTHAFLIFSSILLVYSLLAWDRLAAPSPQFHFVDLAHSFMAGRVDTDTPKQSRRSTNSEDPRGYRDAVKRTLDSGGWNDWASLRSFRLEDGTEVRGRFPWSDASGEKKHMFHTIDGEARKIQVPNDLSRTCGKTGKSLCDETNYYVSFPPFPAIAILPIAAIWGYDTNDVWLTILAAALNGVLLFWFLELLISRGHSTRGRNENIWFTILFAFGSVALFSGVRGEVWFMALIFGVTLNLLFMLAALDCKHPLLAGLMLGFGIATRTPIAFCFIFFVWQLFFPQNRWQRPWKTILRKGMLFAIPVLVCGVALMAYNHARYDSLFEFGHSFLSGAAGKRIRDHGLFNSWYLNANLAAALTNLPRIFSESPFVQVSNHGLGLLITSPILFLLCRPMVRPPLRRALWLALLFAAIPGLLYQNTGWKQFGYRFALDYLPYMVALLAIEGRPLTGRVKWLIVFGIIVNLFGAITFGRFPELYY